MKMKKVNPVRSSHGTLDPVFAKESKNCPSPLHATGLSNGGNKLTFFFDQDFESGAIEVIADNDKNRVVLKRLANELANYLKLRNAQERRRFRIFII